MTERQSLTRPRRNSTSSHTSIRKSLRDIFDLHRRLLNGHQTKLNDCIPNKQIGSELVYQPNEQLLAPYDVAKSNLYESTDRKRCYPWNSNAKHNVHTAQTGRLQTFDRLETGTIGDQKHRAYASPNNLESANANSLSETKGIQAAANADSKSDETFTNIGYIDADTTADQDEDLQNNTINTQQTSVPDDRNENQRQRTVPKNWFICLSVINIILIVFVLIVLLFGQSQDSYFRNNDIKQIVHEYLSSLEGKENKSAPIYCLSCADIDESVAAKYFVKSTKGSCCIKDESKLLTVFSNLNNMKTKECATKLRGLERIQNRVESDIADLQMKVFDKDEITMKGWPKHPEIQKNNRLINVLLTRRRSAIQLKGNAKNGTIKWLTDLAEGKLSHVENVITLQNGGMYIMYSMVRFTKNTCGSNGTIGYAIKQRSSIGPALPIASVYRDCSGGKTSDHDLFIQKSFKLTVGQNNDIFLDIGDLGNLVEANSEHYFGVFEL